MFDLNQMVKYQSLQIKVLQNLCQQQSLSTFLESTLTSKLLYLFLALCFDITLFFRQGLLFAFEA